jgi:predicted HAD superfamily phosphohydrolase
VDVDLDLIGTQLNFMNSQLPAKNLREVCNDLESVGGERGKRVVDKYYASDEVEENASPVALSTAN